MSRRSNRLPLRGAGVLVLLALSLAFASTAGSVLMRARSNSVTYTSTASQDPAGPVISTIVVSSDDTNITFQINTPNRPTFTSDMDYAIFVDSDNTPSTGSQQDGGAEVYLQVTAFTHPMGLGLLFWLGNQWGQLPVDGSATYSSGVTVTVPRGAVEAEDSSGPLPTIAFRVIVWSGLSYDPTTRTYDYSNSHYNWAPPELSGFYSYDFDPSVSSTPSEPEAIEASSFQASRPKAGRVFTASMLVKDSHSGLPAINVGIACVARVSGKLVPVQRKSMSRSGRASCAWRLPKTSQGKQLKGKITTSYPGLKSVSHSFAFRVR